MEDEDKKIDVYLTDEQFNVIADMHAKYAKKENVHSWIRTIAIVLASAAIAYFICFIFCERFL